MYIRKYGVPSDPTIILLAPMMVSGEDLYNLKHSGKTSPVYMPHAKLTIRSGYSHCGYMAAQPKEYVEEIEAFARRGEH